MVPLGPMQRFLPVLCVLAGIVLSGCSSTEPREQPAAVPEVTGEAPVREIWSRRFAEGHDGEYLFMTPVVVEDQVFISTANGYIGAYDARLGRRDWWKQLDARLIAGVGADSDHLYVVTRNGKLMALSHTGEPRWEAALPNESLVPPQSNGRQVIVQTIDGEVLAYDQDDGERSWQYDSNMPVLSFRGNATPYVDGSRVVTGFDNGRVVSLDVTTGRVQWQQALGTASGRTELERIVDVDSSPVVRDGTVYITGYQGKVAALTLRSGEERWSRSVSSLRSPAVGNDNVVVAAYDGRVIGYDLASRREVWRHDKLQWRRLNSPVTLGDHVLVGDFEGYLYAIRQADGSIDGRAQVDGKGIRSPMVRYRDRVILFGNGGQIASYRIVEP
ncbi:Beta-barrel assembly machine subunit BamB [Halospina denitrificans]|uniref:Outer membrane protein assembly factor BamB n=1 Tax=Halospina denitrificans TaxID=332522 RepID=A0A4R7JVV0_9GAMM|nr:outer membrane protein assembly factor BamB [Halospina denitrificans]TDT41627.1 Beta-barrel assembly machine subunit BamB [Halospina denitrificans]